MILPIVKQQDIGNVSIAIPSPLTCSYTGETARLGAEALADFDGSVSLTSDGGFISFAYDEALEEKAEIYRVTVSKSGIRVGFRDARGAVNGAATVALLLRKHRLFAGEILDYPSCSFRSLMIDPGFAVPTMERVESVVRYMALAKYNRLHLHLVDELGPAYLSHALPDYRYYGPGTPFTLSQLREIDALCKRYAIEIIPEIEVPGHAKTLCADFPQFKCQVENAQNWAICPGNDDIRHFSTSSSESLPTSSPIANTYTSARTNWNFRMPPTR